MATLTNTVLGIPRGKIGDFVIYPLNGKTIFRRNGKPGPQNELQMANRQAMSVTMKLLRPMLKFINLGYGLQAKGTDKNPHNLATAYHKKHALKGVYPNIRVDYSKVILSQGDLSKITDMQVQKTATGLQFTWDPKLKYKAEEYDDQVMILIYYTGTKKADQFLNAAKRSEGAHFIEMDEEYLESAMAVYMSLKSADGTSISDSTYLGLLNEKEIAEIPVEILEMKAKKEEEKVISDLKSRFIEVTNSYIQQLEEIKSGTRTEDKAFIRLEAEFLNLKSKMRRIPKEPDRTEPDS
ncbi:DUF6266 family protein [Pedobacter sp. PLR]|uniref:DUF6266 family protein n=1 Tax=Pedobacter sp. PLR TaxID=2994465 RepID=UPI00224822D9|nr:DUF6266 family protein [Pedobacter sp. PLR]MCX2453010.1 DUF6266 family protein [Pedobacter sp. PLR]